MNAVDFSQLASVLRPDKVTIKMSYYTHKYLLGISGSITNPQQVWTDEQMPKVFEGIKITHENIAQREVLIISSPPHIRREISILIN